MTRCLFPCVPGRRVPCRACLETILNLGLNDKSVEGLAAKTGNPRFAYDAYRRFIQMYSSTAMGLSKQPMEDMLHAMKHTHRRRD